MARFSRKTLARLGIKVPARKRKPRPRKKLGNTKHVVDWAAWGIPEPVAEFRFHPTRKWLADFCWVEQKVMLEVDGGAFIHGRHTRGAGFVKDQEKRNEALLLGYRPFHCIPDDLRTGKIFPIIRQALGLE